MKTRSFVKYFGTAELGARIFQLKPGSITTEDEFFDAIATFDFPDGSFDEVLGVMLKEESHVIRLMVYENGPMPKGEATEFVNFSIAILLPNGESWTMIGGMELQTAYSYIENAGPEQPVSFDEVADDIMALFDFIVIMFRNHGYECLSKPKVSEKEE